jgi:hypothetical protein
MQNVHGRYGEPGKLNKSEPWWLTTCSQSPRTVYAAVHKHNNQKGFRAVQEVKAKNGVCETSNLVGRVDFVNSGSAIKTYGWSNTKERLSMLAIACGLQI